MRNPTRLTLAEVEATAPKTIYGGRLNAIDLLTFVHTCIEWRHNLRGYHEIRRRSGRAANLSLVAITSHVAPMNNRHLYVLHDLEAELRFVVVFSSIGKRYCLLRACIDPVSVDPMSYL